MVLLNKSRLEGTNTHIFFYHTKLNFSHFSDSSLGKAIQLITDLQQKSKIFKGMQHLKLAAAVIPGLVGFISEASQPLNLVCAAGEQALCLQSQTSWSSDVVTSPETPPTWQEFPNLPAEVMAGLSHKWGREETPHSLINLWQLNYDCLHMD